jgi:branched-subunit amino acid aminotransferase/4-amino-4-deoxychorismate lyase
VPTSHHSWDGLPATSDQLAFLALHNYGSYTFMQVRQGSVPGLSLHMQRLRSNAEQLYGAAPAEERLRDLLGRAVPAGEPCSVLVTIVSRDLEAVRSGAPVEPEVVVTVSEPRESSTQPISTCTMAYERETPSVKHRGTYGLIRHTRAARQSGFDDALFVDRQLRISEGSTWNALLRREGTWIWPEAAVLQGVTMQLLEQAMVTAGVPHRRLPVAAADIPLHQAAFALNSVSPAKPIITVDDHVFTGDAAAVVQLEELWRGIVPEAL